MVQGIELYLHIYRRPTKLREQNVYRLQRSCGQGYVFTRVCDSVHGGGLWQGEPPQAGRTPLARRPPGKETPRQGEPPWQGEPPPAGRTHPGKENPPSKETPLARRTPPPAYGQ